MGGARCREGALPQPPLPPPDGQLGGSLLSASAATTPAALSTLPLARGRQRCLRGSHQQQQNRGACRGRLGGGRANGGGRPRRRSVPYWSRVLVWRRGGSGGRCRNGAAAAAAAAPRQGEGGSSWAPAPSVRHRRGERSVLLASAEGGSCVAGWAVGAPQGAPQGGYRRGARLGPRSARRRARRSLLQRWVRGGARGR